MLNKYFDKIVCINLIDREDKREYAQNVFRTLQVNVDFFDAQRHPQGGRYGCFHSHMSVIADSYEKGVNRLLVFEDDVKISPSYHNDILQEVVTFLNDAAQDWDYVQLGHFPMTGEKMKFLPYATAQQVDGYPHILKFSGPGTHAYCLNRKGMKKILNSDWKKYISTAHFDVFLTTLNELKAFCVIPMLFEQKFCLGSDNTPISAEEYFERNFACLTDKTNLLYYASLIKYTIQTYKYTIVTVCIFIVCVALFLYVFKYQKQL